MRLTLLDSPKPPLSQPLVSRKWAQQMRSAVFIAALCIGVFIVGAFMLHVASAIVALVVGVAMFVGVVYTAHKERTLSPATIGDAMVKAVAVSVAIGIVEALFSAGPIVSVGLVAPAMFLLLIKGGRSKP